ncbi:MAG TPA: LysR family transcriptional regulator [Sphingobium sp.]
MIDRYTIRYFLAVIDHGNFSRAAAHCHVSQPTLSVGILKLERHLGHTLFQRTNRRVELTVAGARFAVHARRVEAEFNQAERSVREVAAQITIRVGILSTIPTRWHEALVGALRPTLPTERVEFVEARERDILDQLGRGRTDIALTIVGSDNDRFLAEPLFTERYALAMSLDHPLASEQTVEAESLADNVMIVRRNCEGLAATSRHFTAHGVRPFFAAKTTNDDRALALVRSGLGITVMPRSFMRPDIAMPLLAGFALTRTVGLLLAPHVDAAEMRATSAYGAIAGCVRQLSMAIR